MSRPSTPETIEEDAPSLGEQLVRAAEGGKLDEVLSLLDQGAPVDSQCPPPLGMFNSGTAEVMEITGDELIIRVPGIDRHFESSDIRRTALQAAAANGYTRIVSLLIRYKADVHDTPSAAFGRTALQAAAQGGHRNLVEMLLGNGADVNAPPAEYGGSTAVQAAATGGHRDIVQLLVASGADINAPPSENVGFTALQAAASGGHTDLVQLLVASGADVNARPPTGIMGFTALQAAASGGHTAIVQLLVLSGADVNALPTRRGGRTALQAAAGGSHDEIVAILLKHHADPNAPQAALKGVTALDAVCNSIDDILLEALLNIDQTKPSTASPRTTSPPSTKQQIIIERLLTAGANPNQQNEYGYTIVHRACNDIERLSLCTRINLLNKNAVDFAGSTALHHCLRGSYPAAMDILLDWGVDMNIRDNSGSTPLMLAVNFGLVTETQVLLSRGASTEYLRVEKVRALIPGGEMLCLQGAPTMARSITAGSLRNILGTDLNGEVPSITIVSGRFTDAPISMINGNMPNAPPFVISQWAVTINEKLERMRFHRGIPDMHVVLSRNHCKVVLVRDIRVDVGVASAESNEDGSAETGHRDINEFQFTHLSRGIYYIMQTDTANPDGSMRSFLQSQTFVASMEMEYFTIPRTGLEFFLLLLADVEAKWMQLIASAKSHLIKIRTIQLRSAGKFETVIRCLLTDSEQWHVLWDDLDKSLVTINKVKADFIENESLYTELLDEDEALASADGMRDPQAPVVEVRQRTANDIGDSGLPQGDNQLQSQVSNRGTFTKTNTSDKRNTVAAVVRPEDLRVIKVLKERIALFESRCRAGLSTLDRETDKMITLEFSLVSIFEARKSIKMTEVSLSMAMSMKRLSWITFIFLPLMFVSGLFGMNVNLLDSNPSWLWYLLFSVSLLVLVVLVWIIFKYLNISDWIETRIGAPIEQQLKKLRLETDQPLKVGTGAETEVEAPTATSTGSALFGRVSSRWRKPKVDDPESAGGTDQTT